MLAVCVCACFRAPFVFCIALASQSTLLDSSDKEIGEQRESEQGENIKQQQQPHCPPGQPKIRPTKPLSSEGLVLDLGDKGRNRRTGREETLG